jgi:hypothetical protein
MLLKGPSVIRGRSLARTKQSLSQLKALITQKPTAIQHRVLISIEPTMIKKPIPVTFCSVLR